MLNDGNEIQIRVAPINGKDKQSVIGLIGHFANLSVIEL